MSARKPEGCAAGLSDLKRGFMIRTSAVMGLLWDGEDETQWMKLK